MAGTGGSERRRHGPTWPSTRERLLPVQRRLAAAEPPAWQPPASRLLVAGCFVCFPRDEGGAGAAGEVGAGAAGEPAWAAAALTDGRRLLESAVAVGEAGAPYEPGLLVLREGPLLEAALRALPTTPDVVLVNATGRDHPRGAGLTLHLGAVLDLPSVGVTDRPLAATGDPPGEARGDRSPLVLEGREVGCLLRTRRDARPVAVHPGWRTDVDAAVEVVLRSLRRARSPAPLRLARRLAREARARTGG